MTNMKFIDDIRRENLQALAEEVGGVAALARTLERSESQVSQWIRGAAHSVTGRRRGMKSETARWIEVIVRKPEGWLDHDRAQHGHRAEQSRADYAVERRHTRRLVLDVAELAEQIDDDGLRELLGVARYLAVAKLLAKAKQKSSA